MSMDQATAALLEQFNQQAAELQPHKPTIEASRAGARAMFLSLAGDSDPGCRVETLQLAATNHLVPARLYQPQQLQVPDAIVLFLHGGGWSLGDLDCYDALVRSLCQQSGVRFLSVEYRLAPDHPYPAGLDDASLALRWLHHQAAELGISATKIAVMGDSAGGNLALALSIRASRSLHLPIAAQYLIYPVLDVHSPHDAYPSRLQFGNGDYLLARSAIDDTRNWYLTDNERSDNPEISPLLQSQLDDLPPTSLLLANFDPLLDEGKVLAERLQALGLLQRLDSYDSIHAFVSFGILPISQHARSQLAKQLREDLLAIV
ncbi:alpha/beta hydrolase [Alkalimonas sp. NCh-2]|uniref:alpha/beta hydrolase n=1 Tax=Alkalimonas sp. NCh-2 TaxID=3144846 RepID=UPI0031F6E1CC